MLTVSPNYYLFISVYTASVVYALVVCLSVCLCVCVFVFFTSSIVSKRLNLGSRKPRRTIAIGLAVLVAKCQIKLNCLREIQMGSFPGGASNAGWVGQKLATLNK